MQFDPGLHEASLARGQCTGKNRQVVNRENGFSPRRDYMKMGTMMPLTGLGELRMTRPYNRASSGIQMRSANN